MDRLDIEKASASRIYDYFLGGAHNFPADRQAAAEIEAIIPDVALNMRANRAFLRRAVQFLVAQGMDQFLDIGAGTLTVGNVHEIAQHANPAAHVVYVDIDPVAVHLGLSVLEDNPTAAFIQADARRPDEILAHPETRRLIDPDRPLAVLLVALFHFVPDDAEALATVHSLRDAVPAGSYLVIAHVTNEGVSPEVIERTTRLFAGSANPGTTRSRDEIATFFTGLDLVEPGLVYAPLWHPESEYDVLLSAPERAMNLVGVGRKPCSGSGGGYRDERCG